MKTYLKKLSQNSFLQGGIILTVANLITSFFNYLFNTLAARALGPQGYSEITTLFSYITILSVPINVGVAIVIQKIGSQNKGRYNYALDLEKWMYIRFKKWWIIAVLFACIIPFIPAMTNLSPSVGYSLIPLLVVTCILSFYDAAFQGTRMFTVFAIISIFTTIIKLIGSTLLTIHIGDINTVITFIFISLLLKYILSIQIFHNDAPAYTKNIPAKRVSTIMKDKQIWLTSISLFALYILNNIDIIFVKKAFSATDAGIYSSWSLFAKIIMYFTAPLMSVSYIFFSSSDQQKNHQKTLIYSLIVLFVISIGSYVFYNLYGSFILQLFFGEKYIQVVPLLPQASIFGSIYLMIFFITQYFMSQKSKYTLIVPAIIPLYILLLIQQGRSIQSIIYVNIFFGSIILLCYLIAFGQHFLKQRVE